MQKLKVRKLNPNAKLPTRAHAGDAGLDLCALEGGNIPAGHRVKIPTGIAIEVALGFVGIIKSRSSLAANKGVDVAAGVVDHAYTGDVTVVAYNNSKNVFEYTAGDRIAQLLVVPISLPTVEEVSEFSETARGADGFGSTGQ